VEPQEFGSLYEAFLEHVHPDDRDFVADAYEKSVKNKTGYDIEHRILLKNGKVKYVNERCVTEYDEKGTPLRSLGTVLDITERKNMEEELLAVKHDWEDTFNTITDMITVHDKDFNIIRANKAAEKILGLPLLEKTPD
jgi:PAS domain-containing protein